MDMEAKIKYLLSRRLCTHCIGRQFAQLGHGLENWERGEIVRRSFGDGGKRCELAFTKENASRLLRGKYGDREVGKWEEKERGRGKSFYQIKDEGKKEKEDGECELCGGIFKKIEEYAEMIIEAVDKRYEYNTFLIGSRPPVSVVRKEEELWEIIGIENTEPIKAELNRLLGKEIQKRTKKEVDFEQPDLLIIMDFEKDRVELQVRSLYVYGEYSKLVRGIPQSRWYCSNCRGKGCDECNWTGKKYETSLQEIIAEPLLEMTNGVDTKFHGAGREDIDALCLGKRPFVIEVLEPEIRSINLKKLEKINGRIKLYNLKICDSKTVKHVKKLECDKVYRVKVEFEKPVSGKDLEKLKKSVGPVKQYTPQRVEHRRANRIRIRRIKSLSWKVLDRRHIDLIVEAEAGLYVKEFVTGDGGRTKPSVTEITGVKANWVELDVLEIRGS